MATRTPSVPTKQQAVTAYAKLPLAFVANGGQLDRRVRYAGQAGGTSFFLTRRESSSRSGRARPGSRFACASSTPTPSRRSSAPDGGRKGQLLDRGRPGPVADEAADLRRDRLPRAVAGIDLRVRGREGKLKYEFRLRAGSRSVPDPVRLPRPGAAVARPGRGNAHRGRRSGSSASAAGQLSGGRRRAGRGREPVRARTSRRLRSPWGAPRPKLSARHRSGPSPTPRTWAGPATTATASPSTAAATPT